MWDFELRNAGFGHGRKLKPLHLQGVPDTILARLPALGQGD
jgi:hypothetical protein